MEEPPKKKKRGLFHTLFRYNPKPRMTYDTTVNEYSEGNFEVTSRPILTEDQVLEMVPFAESIDQLEIDPQSVKIIPSENTPQGKKSETLNQTCHGQSLTNSKNSSSTNFYDTKPIETQMAKLRPSHNTKSENRALDQRLHNLVIEAEITSKIVEEILQNHNDEYAIREIKRQCSNYHCSDLYLRAEKHIRKNPKLLDDSKYEQKPTPLAVSSVSFSTFPTIVNDTATFQQSDQNPNSSNNQADHEKPIQQKIETKVYSPTFNVIVKSSVIQEPADQNLNPELNNISEKLNEEADRDENTSTENTSDDTNHTKAEKNENSSETKSKWSKEAKEGFKAKGERQLKAQKQKKQLEDIKKSLAEKKEKDKKSSQAKQAPLRKDFSLEGHNQSVEAQNDTLKQLSNIPQQSQNSTYQQQLSYNPPYNTNNPPPTRQRHSIDSFEQEIYTITGNKSKKMIENDKMDEEEQKLAQAQEDDDDEMDWEEAEQVYKQQQQIKKSCNLMQLQHNEIKRRLGLGIFSEHHKKALDQAWVDAINKANNGLLPLYNHEKCDNLRGTEYFEQCMNKRCYFDMDYNKMDPTNLIYFPLFQEFCSKVDKIFDDYNKWEKYEYLPQLRNQPENNILRRNIEVRHFNPQDFQNFQVIEKQINAKYDKLGKLLPWGVGFWEKSVGLFSSEKSSRQKLQEEQKKETEETLNNFIDEISNRYRKLHEAQEKLEKKTKKLEKKKEKHKSIQEKLKELRAKLNDDKEKEDDDSRSLANFGTFISPKQYDPTKNLHESTPDSVDWIITVRNDKFLNQLAIDPDEFYNFKGKNVEQDELHRKLSKAINSPLVINAEPPAKVQEMYQSLVKATYILNKENYSDLAQNLLEFCNPYTFGLALGKELCKTVAHPIEYIQRRISEMHGSIESDLPFLEKYEKVETDVKAIVLAIKKLIAENSLDSELKKIQNDTRKLLIQHRQKVLSQTTIDLLVDFGLIFATGKTFDVVKLNKTFIKRPRSLQPITSRHIGFLDDFFQPSISPALTQEAKAIAKTVKDVASKFNKEPISFGRTIPRLPDFSGVVQPFYAPAKRMLPRSKPYAECVKDLTNKIAIAKSLTKQHSATADLDLLNNAQNYNSDGRNNNVSSLSETRRVNYIKPNQGNLIKEFTSDTVKSCQRHIFSKNHKNDGIMNLGATEEIILERFIEFIVEADKARLMQIGDNTIHTIIHSQETIIKARLIDDGVVQSINGYLKTSKNPTSKGNAFTFYLEKYK